MHSSQYERLSPADHGLATELVMGVLRWRSRLDEEISRFSDKRVEKLDLEVLTALRLAAYQLLFLDRVPERAAVHESVELVKRARKGSAVPFANAVLRKLAGGPQRLKPPVKWSANAALKRRSTQDPVEEQKDDTEKSGSAAELSRRSGTSALAGGAMGASSSALTVPRQICGYDQHAPADCDSFG